MLKIAGSADAAVVNFFHARVATLLDDLGCKIDLVMRRANAGAELRNEIARIRLRNRCRINAIAFEQS